MKKYIHASIFCLIFVVVVAAAKSGRYVKDNVFLSTYPKLSVKVDPKFKYLGQLDYTVEERSPDHIKLVTYDTKTYVFVDAVDNKPKKAFYIQIRREQTKYVGNLLGDAKANIKSGICNVGGEQYRCFTRVISVSPDEPIAKFISEQGYALPACVLFRTYSRTDISKGIYLVVITYVETFSDSGLSCESWRAENQLTNEQQKYIEQFDRNCKASFNVVGKGYDKPGLRGLLGG